MPDGFIPLNRPPLVGTELEYLADVLRTGRTSGDGAFTARCREYLEAKLRTPAVLLTTSGTHALELAAMMIALDSRPEVIVPAFSFPSTANAFLLQGATLVFSDVRPDTLNLDEALLASRIGPRTGAIVVVHYGGVGAEMELINRMAAEHGIAVVEDNAHGLFGTVGDRPLGTFGRFGALSFHESKNFSSGEGGALLINHEADIERAEILREKGTNRSRFSRGEVDRYEWLDVGSSYLASDLLAAVLYAQLEVSEHILARRRRVWDRYRVELSTWAQGNGTQLPPPPANRYHPAHLFYVVMPTPEARDGLSRHLRDRRILAPHHYLPLHLSPMGRSLGGKVGDHPVTEDVSRRLIRLPLYADLEADDQSRVIQSVLDFPI